MVCCRRGYRASQPGDVACRGTRYMVACLPQESSLSETLVHPPVTPIGHRARARAVEDGQPAAPDRGGQSGPLGSPTGAKGCIVAHDPYKHGRGGSCKPAQEERSELGGQAKKEGAIGGMANDV